MKPDFVAPDGVSTTGVGGFGEPFCGTSAAAPHIAGLLALLGPAYPNQTPYNLLETYAAMPDGSCTSNCTQNGVFGFGLPSLTAMLNAGAFPPPTAAISTPSADVSIAAGSKQSFTGSCSANGASAVPTIDWNFGSGSGITDSTLANPTATFATAGSFTVTLTCTDALGANSASVKVTVNAPSSGGGGGDLGLLELAGLLTALTLSRRRRQR
jgi:subtilisin family serine protease